jgi:endonuclease/exonuclease/phosphatase family metal-dependent hydrolase
MKMTLGIFLLVVFSFVGFLAWAGYPWSIIEKNFKAEILHIEPEGMVNNEEAPSVIKVMTWNLGFLFGEGSEGPGYEARDHHFYQSKLDQMVKQLGEWQPDIVCLQEVDFDSARSQYINQAQYLAKKANYPYVAEAVSWDAHYIPFPYWPVSRHFGKMKSGGAILSKYPILDSEVQLLAKPISQPWWYNIFYLHRYFQKVTIQLGEKKFKFVNLHL